MGDVKPRLRQAQQMINAGIGIVLRCSHVYESKAWGFTAADDFKNQAMEVDTDLAPEELLAALQEIEGASGATVRRKPPKRRVRANPIRRG